MKFDLMCFLVEKVLPGFFVLAVAALVVSLISGLIVQIKEKPRMFVLRESPSETGLECVQLGETLSCNWDKYNAATGGQ